MMSILAYPRPDFAINGVVSGSVTVKTVATGLSADIANAGIGTVNLTSGYTVLSTLSTSLEFIGDEIIRVAAPLASQLTNLSIDDVGPIETVYAAINASIIQFDALIDGGLNDTIANIYNAAGTDYIVKQFADAFKSTKLTLDQLIKAVDQLKSDVDKARTAAGSTNPIPSATIRANIPARTVNSVITAIRNLRARVPLITYVIDSSLDNLHLVDLFIIELQNEVEDGAARYQQSYQAFQFNLDVESTSVNTQLTTNYGANVSTIISGIQTDLENNAVYISDLQTNINSLSSAYESIDTEADKIAFAFNIYSTNVPNLIGNIMTELATRLCNPLQTVSKVQIANAGFSDFCFSKYSPRVFSLVQLTVDAFDMCFEKELARLMNLSPVVERIATQISYNTADLLSNLNVCLAIVDPTAEGACFTTIAPYYAVLATKVTAHTTTVINLVNAETTASFNRLGACLYSSLSLVYGYPLLEIVKTQLIAIADNFTQSALAVSNSIDAFALSNGTLDSAFGQFNNASGELFYLITQGLTGYLNELDTKLDKSISTMLDDALQEVNSELIRLAVLMDSLKAKLKLAVKAAASNEIPKAVLRQYVPTNLTNHISKSVITLKAGIPLVTYIIANSIENLKTADDYIIVSGNAASQTFDDVSKGLENLGTEVQQYSDDTSEIAAIIDPVYKANFNFSGVNLSSISLIQNQMNEYTQAIPLVSDGLGASYSTNACGHLVRLVKVLISNGPYADYCYNKYSPHSFALFDQQSREVSRCVDQEITRLLKLQQVLLAMAKTLLFDIEDVLAQVTLCSRSPLVCNTNEVETLFNNVNIAARRHQNTMRNIVNYETVAGLNRLSACFSTSKCW
uniref:Protein TsetseEP domain-containing protein n=1 Tax=Anopheles melas TaxID=34690 RepID=A0A182U4J1_9DIPT